MKHKIDYLGTVLLIVAAATMILGFSWAGSTYPWASPQIIGVVGVAIVLWIPFLLVERKAGEPMLDPQVLGNRTFLTQARRAGGGARTVCADEPL